ncbi:hypothetical protein BDB01DRAFT_851313 [Pilobolus umbonatus]|nr:hypothetical protein BDB01DRAFT_851313 [Pilobolus umbonatus]
MSNQALYYETAFENKTKHLLFRTSNDAVEFIKAWALENNFILSIDKSEKNRRVWLICNMGKESRVMVSPEERKRFRNSIKNNCPFMVKVTYSKKRGSWSFLKQNAAKNEDKHNHPCISNTARLLHDEKKTYIPDEAESAQMNQSQQCEPVTIKATEEENNNESDIKRRRTC